LAHVFSPNTMPGNALVHRAGCDLLEIPVEDNNPFDDITATRDDLIAYGLAIRPHYDKLGRLIGQLAGIFLLAQVRGRFDPDFEAVSTPLERARECSDSILSITPPKAAKRLHWALLRAMSMVVEVTGQFSDSIHGSERVRECVSEWTERLKRANALVRWASDTSLGLHPVDLSQACCCCGALAK
jgi:hypothetical protein